MDRVERTSDLLWLGTLISFSLSCSRQGLWNSWTDPARFSALRDTSRFGSDFECAADSPDCSKLDNQWNSSHPQRKTWGTPCGVGIDGGPVTASRSSCFHLRPGSPIRVLSLIINVCAMVDVCAMLASAC